MLGQYSHISLADLARHNCIEHDASVCHADCDPQSELAPIHVSPALLRDSEQHARDKTGLTIHDIAKLRLDRERESKKRVGVALDAVHAEIARGEMALLFGVFARCRTDGVEEMPLEYFRELFLESFPKGWKPTKKQGLLKTMKMAGEIRRIMRESQRFGLVDEKSQ